MSIYEQLYDWQKKIVDNFKQRSSYGIFLQMGLGKTPISLAFAEQNRCNKILVITINSKALETENDSGSFLCWAKQSSIKYDLLNKNSKYISMEPTIFVVNYEGLFTRGKSVRGLKLHDRIRKFIDSCKHENVAIIVDESHKIKNLQSRQTKAVMQIKRELTFVADNVYTYLLTGTPFTTGYIDIYSQLKILGFSDTKQQFVDEFCIRGNIPGLLGWQQPIIGYKNVDSLFRLIHRYAITMKTEDIINLPEQTFVDHILPISKDMITFIQEKITGDEIVNSFTRHGINDGYDDYKINSKKKYNNPFFRDIGYRIYDGYGKKYGLNEQNSHWIAETAGSFWLRARQLSIGFQGSSEASFWFDRRRLNLLKTFLEQNEDNYLLFYNYTPELLELYDICDKLGYNVDVYCGECKSLCFYEKYSKMNESEKLTNRKNIILANFASGSTGMNWQEYNQCILFSIPLFKDYEQAIARIHRLGQKRPTIVHRFYQNSWLDENMMKALNEQKIYSVDMFESDLKRIQKILESS